MCRSKLFVAHPLFNTLGLLAIAGVFAGCSDSAKGGNQASAGGSPSSSNPSNGGSAVVGGASFAGGASGTLGTTVGGAPAVTGGSTALLATGGLSAAGGSNVSGGASSQATSTKTTTGGVVTGTGGKSAGPTGGISGVGGRTTASGGKTSGTGGSSANGGSVIATGGKTSATGGVGSTAGTSGTTAGALRWVGRVVPISATSAKFAWQGAGLVANVTGSTIAVKLRSEGSSTVYFQPVIDHTPGTRFNVDPGADRTVSIATGLGTGEHLVEIYRETEAYYGVSTFLGFTSGTVTGAPASNGRLLEVVGDSISAGYGNLGTEPHPNYVATPECHWTAENSSWYATYAAVAGHALGAEVSTIARSGAGMFRNIQNDQTDVLPNMYDSALGTTDTTVWPFTTKASAVVINLGTNDWAKGSPGDSYETAYVQFIATVRGKYPDAWIFLTIGPMVNEPDFSEIKTRLASVVSKVQASTADTKLLAFDFGIQDTGENGSIPTGCDWHPNVTEHKRMAGILQAQLTAKLGWQP